jgi:cyclopropane fatty-acyl-phospholipid synthase-like methyltransferase
MLMDSDWKVTEVENLDADYECWYINLMERIKSKREAIIKSFGVEVYDILRHRYVGLLQAIKDKKLGGGIVYANSCNSI